MHIEINHGTVAWGGGETVLSEVNLSIERGWTAVVGSNGAGKSTLIGAIVGTLPLATGTRHVSPASLKVAALPQDSMLLNDCVEEFAASWDRSALRLRSLYELNDGDIYRWHELSSGERQRWHLAACQHLEPHVLVLDEPGNHLDEAARALVTNALKSFDGIGIIASHDQGLLRELATHVVWVERGTAASWRCGFQEAKAAHDAEAASRLQAALRSDAQARTERVRQKAALQLLQEVETNRSTSTRMRSAADSDQRGIHQQYRADRAAGLQASVVARARTRLERSETATTSIRDAQGDACARFDFVSETGANPPSLSLMAPVGVTNGSFATVFVEPRTRLWVRGANGAGKSHLLRTLVDAAPARARIFYLPQELDAAGPAALLSGEDVQLRSRVLRVAATLGLDVARALRSERLSQGEARKLVLANALLCPFDYLLLDEPTNHMDIALQRELQAALLRFERGLVIVCHDEEFMQPFECTEFHVTR